MPKELESNEADESEEADNDSQGSNENEVWTLDEMKDFMEKVDKELAKAMKSKKPKRGAGGTRYDKCFGYRWFTETFVQFGRIFGPKMVNEHLWIQVKQEVAEGHKSILQIVGNGAIALTWFSVQNNIVKIFILCLKCMHIF